MQSSHNDHMQSTQRDHMQFTQHDHMQYTQHDFNQISLSQPIQRSVQNGPVLKEISHTSNRTRPQNKTKTTEKSSHSLKLKPQLSVSHPVVQNMVQVTQRSEGARLRAERSSET